MINNYFFFSKYYDKIYSKKPYKKEFSFIKEILKGKEFKEILEFGCGTGNYTQIIKKNYNKSNVTGVDKSLKMIKIAKSKNIGAKFLKKDLLNYKSKNKYDAIFCLFHTINYITNLEKFFKNSYNLLNENGYLIIDYLRRESVGYSNINKKKISFKLNGQKVIRYGNSKINRLKDTLEIYYNYLIKQKKQTINFKEKYELKLHKESMIRKLVLKKFDIICSYEWLKKYKPSKKNWTALIILKKK